MAQTKRNKSNPKKRAIKFRQELFWDVDPKKIDPKKHATYIIERILDFGNTREVKWLFRFYPDQLIKNTAKKSRGMTKMSKQFWLLMFDSNDQKIGKKIQAKNGDKNRAFWATHENSNNDKPPSKTIRLRLPAPLLYRIKAIADQNAVAYQSFINTLLDREVSKTKLDVFQRF